MSFQPWSMLPGKAVIRESSFLDRINEANPTPLLGEIESTNPCGEVPLLPYEACVLGSINLLHMVKEKEGKWGVDFEKLRRTVRTAVHFLDNVIDRSQYPIKQIAERTRGNRKIGLGVMGLAHFFIRLGIPYASPKAIEVGKGIMSFIQHQARERSAELAEERGVFRNFEGPRLRPAWRIEAKKRHPHFDCPYGDPQPPGRLFEWY